MDTNIQKYMAFVKTIEYGSFTKAAEILNYSQSGISRMISDLEKEWNILLLERSKSGVELTSEGLKLLSFIENLCREYEKLEVQVDALKGLESGLIRIGTFSSIATHWLPNIIKKFQQDYPNIEYELLLGNYDEIENWILKGRVDFGFLRLPTKSRLETIFLMEDELMVVLPENHKLADKEYFPIKELSNYPFMLLEKGVKMEITEIFEKYNITPDIHFTTLDDYVIMSMVENGLGISILPRLILQRNPYKITAKRLEVATYRNIGLAYRNKKSLSLAVKKFLEYIE